MHTSRLIQCARLFTLAALALAALLGGRASALAQPWKMFAEKIKQEANERRSNSNDEVEFAGGVPGSSGRMLDFSNALGDDALNAELPAPPGESEEEALDEAQVSNAPTFFSGYAPSYRSFPEMRAASRLNDVCFSSPTHGCAVGDRGVILITTNGGVEWRLIESVPTDANLYAVSFLDDYLGIAVGGRVVPLGRAGRGVLLRTTDGGETWLEIPTPSYPILRDARIIARDCAWLAGDSSNLYPSGLFTSENDALDWTAVQGDRRQGWRATLYDPDELLGLGVTTEGKAQRVEGDQTTRNSPQLGARRARDVAYDGSTGAAWLVGDEGLVMRSTDFGANWASVGAGLPNGAQNYFDLYGVVARDGFVGAFGAPGTQFFRSDDGGATWFGASTGVTTPLRKAWFVDGSRGWAVGDFGVIIATEDGGRTWQTQRRGGERAAILGLFGRIEDAPLEAFVQLSGDESFLTEVALLARETDQEGTSDEIPILERFNEALVETGAHGVVQEWRFSLNPSLQADSLEKIVARFDAENDGLGLARLRERIVRLIRTWRPDALLVADSTSDVPANVATTNFSVESRQNITQLVAALASNANKTADPPRDPLRELILAELPRAIQNAADPTAYPEHMSICRLEPYQTPKARAVCRGGQQGNLSIAAEYFCPTLGRSVSEIADFARKLTALKGFERAVDSTSFQTLYSATPTPNADATFFDGLSVPYGSASRRARQSGTLEALDALAARANERRQDISVLNAVVGRMGTNERLATATLSQMNRVVAGKDVDFGLEYLATAGRLFIANGAYESAETALKLIPSESYGEPRAREALESALQFYSGSEPTNAMLNERRVSSGQSGGANYVYNDLDGGERLVKSVELAEAVRDFAPDAFMSPELRFPYAVTQLKRGDLQGAMRFYLNRSLVSSDDFWGARAATEYWLRAPIGDPRGQGAIPCPMLTLPCRSARGKPYLDGELEDAIWSASPKTPLSIPLDVELTERQRNNRALSTNLGASVSFLYDAEFLYVGITCPTPDANQDETPPQKSDAARARDVALDEMDRVELMLDVDGDYATAYQFSIARNGWLNDSLWRDSNWNPPIFIANKEEKAQWALEMAIPLATLQEERPKPGDVWRIAIKRVAPGRGVEIWNAENSDRGKDAFGLLKFE